MGPQAAVEVLKESLYRGADNVALISDRRFAGADTLATSYALARAVEKLGTFDAIFCGRQAIDGDTAQVGPQTAEKLGLNQITCVSLIEKIDVAKKTITARRSIEGGFEKVRTKWPVLLTFTDEGYLPRPASAKRVMAFKNAAAVADDQPYDESYLQTEKMMNRASTITLWDVNAIKADPDACGLAGSPTWVKKIESVVLKSGEIKMVENTEVAIAGMIRELTEDHSME
jgi:electron transfer flavoprotein beta subunit